MRRLRQLEGTHSVHGTSTLDQWEASVRAKAKAALARQRGGAAAAAAGVESDYGGLFRPEPFDHGRDTIQEYLKQTPLSPWVPAPDSVARKSLDLAQLNVHDIHVDLGCGDGRINFHALDYPSGGAAQSIGIDVDPAILRVANERLTKRHPVPSNLTFHTGDLANPSDPVWDMLLDVEPTVWTMYFAPDGLHQLRPILEDKLRILLERKRTKLQQQQQQQLQPHTTDSAAAARVRCLVLTIGCEMPGWQSRQYEVVLGTQIHMYDWGHSVGVVGGGGGGGNNTDGHNEKGDNEDEYDDGYEVLGAPVDDPLWASHDGSSAYYDGPDDGYVGNEHSGHSAHVYELLSKRFPGAKLIDGDARREERRRQFGHEEEEEEDYYNDDDDDAKWLASLPGDTDDEEEEDAGGGGGGGDNKKNDVEGSKTPTSSGEGGRSPQG